MTGETAGQRIGFLCDFCGFARRDLEIGRGPRGRQHIAIACSTCADIHTVTVATWRDTTLGIDHDEPVWNQRDACPACHGRVRVLDPDPPPGDRQRCPNCLQTRMRPDPT